MDKVVYCSECHIMFFDVSAKTCHICREGTLLDITHLIKNAAQHSVQADELACDDIYHDFLLQWEEVNFCDVCGTPIRR